VASRSDDGEIVTLSNLKRADNIRPYDISIKPTALRQGTFLTVPQKGFPEGLICHRKICFKKQKAAFLPLFKIHFSRRTTA
jgi:hypothetical protein